MNILTSDETLSLNPESEMLNLHLEEAACKESFQEIHYDANDDEERGGGDHVYHSDSNNSTNNMNTSQEIEADANADANAIETTETQHNNLDATMEEPPTNLENEDQNTHQPSHSTSSSSMWRRHRWVTPILGAAFLCTCLVSSILRPYEVIIERRNRPMRGRQIFKTATFSFNKLNRRWLGNDDDGGGNNNYYNNDDGKGNDDGNDDGNDGGGDDAYYNVTDDGGNETYYEYYEEDVDDFYTFVDDSIEIKQVFPLEWSDYIGFICTSLSIILSIGGGIGPGAILVAVFIIVMDFDPKVAIPLSCITGLGVTTLGTMLNMRKRHPLSDRPLIDWDLVLIMEPLTLFGAIAGTYLNKIIGSKFLIVLLVFLLSVIAHNTLKKARKMHHAEELYIKRMLWAKQKRRNSQNPILATIPSNKSFDGKLAEADPPFIPRVHPQSQIGSKKSNSEPLLPRIGENDEQNDDAGSIQSSVPSDGSYSSSFQHFIVLRKADAESVKSSIIEEEADPMPQNKMTYIFTMFLGVIAFNVFKGGAAFESPLGIVCGSLSFWIVEFLTTCWLGICTVLAARYLLKRHAIKEAVGFDYVRGDIRWDVRTILFYPIACVVAGLVSGMFGVGCAVLIAPMLVGIGVNPQVAAATCACMNFFTSLAAASSFAVLGSLAIDHQYAVALFFIGIFSMFVGRWVSSFSIQSTKIKKNKRLERHSYMAYSMGLVVLVSALSMTVEALLDVVNHSYDNDEVDGICDLNQIY